MTPQQLVPNNNDLIAVWFSCGAASAVAAKMTIEKYKHRCKIRIVNNPVIEEDADNRRFLKDVEKWLNHPIEFAINPDYSSCSAVDVWEKRQYMAGINGAPCTTLLKKHARGLWEDKNNPDWHVLGFTAEEKSRYDRFVLSEKGNTLPILIEEEITKQDCFNILQKAGLSLPLVYYSGYPNANCIGCVKATAPTYWNHVRKHHPDVFAQRAEQSRRIGARLVRVRGKRIFLDELSPNEKGKSMKSMKVECGPFCKPEKF